LEVVSTDGHRLTRVVKPWEGADVLGVGAIIPPKGYAQLGRIFGGEATVRLARKGNDIAFAGATDTLLVRLIDDVFPDFAAAIPRSSRNVLTCPKATLEAAVRRAEIVAGSEHRGAKFTATMDTMTIAVENPDVGSVTEDVPIDLTEPDLGAKANIEIGFNVEYVAESLKLCPSATVVWELNGPLAPSLVRDSEGSESFVLIMPMKM